MKTKEECKSLLIFRSNLFSLEDSDTMLQVFEDFYNNDVPSEFGPIFTDFYGTDSPFKTTIVENVFDVPFKCDADISYNWYFNNLCAEVRKKYNDLLKQGINEKDAFIQVSSQHPEFLLDNIIEVIFRDFQKDKSESDWINRYNQIMNS